MKTKPTPEIDWLDKCLSDLALEAAQFGFNKGVGDTVGKNTTPERQAMIAKAHHTISKALKEAREENQSELNFYRNMEVEVGGLQPYKTQAVNVWNDLQNRHKQGIKELK